ncbi:Uncharacterised protein [Mycobacterium tuberculosis]|uniref:Uncharacterized protein n=1 Tax=Mycobacterium tuberculosis TaxID=1773 RepID=A0A0U0SM11_MYCTX|nr:hypothetical protein CAB90_03280 [Mycobacterium tuberculosis]CKR73889.1 Uncharacterised protein [Mycobacterium tuberculosis]CKS05683.1 Uncharacterised protein [Mycobacterium tuberculosis]CKS44708.1 Uncharacterised protein [Mycobacterium tuberculosis]CNM50213.1 Uncharacterised protein [Mycobacterium tuberculosis]
MASFGGEITTGRGGCGHQPVDIALTVAQGDLVGLGTGKQLLGQGGQRAGAVRFDIYEGGIQLRMLKCQHPCDAT